MGLVKMGSTGKIKDLIRGFLCGIVVTLGVVARPIFSSCVQEQNMDWGLMGIPTSSR
jgi:hypothetical protein